MKKISTEVIVIMSHLVITLAIIAIYAYTLYTGHGDETLKTVLTVIVGYWFGAMGFNAKPKTVQKTEDKEV